VGERPEEGPGELPGETLEPALAARLRAAGQGHVVAHAATLPPGPRSAFLEEVSRVPWERLARAFREPPGTIPPELRPPEALTWRRQENEGGILRRLGADGEALLRAGKVATALLAGGQGTRLGHAGPKGTFVLGPTPDRTLYAILCERVLAAGRRAGTPVPLVVMTGPDTDAPTREAFARSGHFGLDPALVEFVRQGELPALDDRGRALLSGPGRLALSPDGHGGLVEAFHRAGTFDRLRARGVEVLTTFQVDNPLGRPLDPVFLGWVLERKAVAAGKAVRKRDPSEKVGVFARDLDGRVRIVEYAEMPEGGLPDLVLGSIALHAFSLPWLASLVASPAFSLPFHKATKRVPFLGDDGRLVTPAAPNAVKLEQFLFDLLPLAPRVAIQEVDRRREFAPVKNASGEDSPATARAAVAAEIARWHRVAGVPVPDPVPPLSPLVADGPEDLRA
jgi:UDP-N-acetylglucosamine/UDP-N-acetylgalactosamine diphosphorylase